MYFNNERRIAFSTSLSRKDIVNSERTNKPIKQEIAAVKLYITGKTIDCINSKPAMANIAAANCDRALACIALRKGFKETNFSPINADKRLPVLRREPEAKLNSPLSKTQTVARTKLALSTKCSMI